jgi:HAMP domain-containing protein/putative methionine-R-sulfoxide reductase with GAF domain
MTSAIPLRSVPLQTSPRRSLGQRLALILLPIALIPMLILGGAVYFRSRALLKTQAASQLTTTAQAKLRPLLDRTDTLELRMELGAQDLALRQATETLLRRPPSSSDYLQALESAKIALAGLEVSETQRQFTQVLLARASDGVVLASTEPAWEGVSLPSVAQGLLPSDSTVTLPLFGDPIFGPGELALVTSATVRGVEDTSRSMYLLGINTDLQVGALMREMLSVWSLRGFSIVERGKTFIALEPDIILTLSNASMLPTATTGVNHPVFVSAAARPSGTLEYTNPEGVPMLAAYEWLPDWKMGVVVELPQGEVLTDLNQLAPFTAVLIVAAALLTMVAVAFTSNRVIRPVTRLVEFADRISRGDWRFRLTENRDDEVGALSAAFNRMAGELSDLYGSLEQKVEDRTRQVRTAAEVARAITSTPSLEELLSRAVELIRDRFGYDHVSLFLLDEERRFAVLRESTGEVGALLKARGHRLEVGSQSMIGWVTANNRPRLATDVGQDPLHMVNELLPETRSEAALPLQVTGRVLGALDVQSKKRDAFTPEDLEILQTLADQLSTALLNARLADRSVRAADRARLISQITIELTGKQDLAEVLQHTAQSLHKALGGPEIVVRIATADGRGNGPASR